MRNLVKLFLIGSIISHDPVSPNCYQFGDKVGIPSR